MNRQKGLPHQREPDRRRRRDLAQLAVEGPPLAVHGDQLVGPGRDEQPANPGPVGLGESPVLSVRRRHHSHSMVAGGLLLTS